MSTPRDDLGQIIVQSAAEVEQLPWRPLGDTPGVSHKVLWRSGDVVLGMIRLEPGAENPAHVHQGAHHHILITQGGATMLGRPLDAGSYVYVPPGTAHEVVDVGPQGCTFFYTYRPVELPPPRVAHSPLDEDWGATGSLA